jgi:hypothetical protein
MPRRHQKSERGRLRNAWGSCRTSVDPKVLTKTQLVYVLGAYFNNQLLQLIGLILFGHSSMDRALGYGLKYPDSFQNTHLGIIGKQAAHH